MDDSDLFGVTDPVTGQVNYCCVMGSAGEVFGLCVYRGREGLDLYLSLIFNDLDPDIDDVWAIQDALVAEFASRSDMDKEDLDVIKSLGCKFRGAHNYPRFRSHVPAYYPWFLEEDEALFLTVALECASDLAIKVNDNPDILVQPEDSQFLTYFPVKKKKGESFESRWETPPPLEREKVNIPSLDELQIRRIKKKNLRQGSSSWEVGTFFTPSFITDRDKPYWTRLCMVAHHGNGLVLHIEPMDPEMADELQIRDTILGAIEKSSSLPAEILTIDETVYDLLSLLADPFKWKILLVEELPAIWEAKEDLIKSGMMG